MTPGAPGDALASASLALARRFHGGATLWCWSPSWPSHAEHVAVEFVHPVIVGKPALPAVAVRSREAADRLRGAARSGDVVVIIGDGDDPLIADVVRRAPAWGVDSIWLAFGHPAPGDTGAHVVWLGVGVGPAEVVCAYHLLWELTHVCLEHSGVLEVAPLDEPVSCPACMDSGELGEVQTLGCGTDAGAEVIVRGMTQSVDLSLVEPCEPGDLVVVHAGVALTKLAVAAHG